MVSRAEVELARLRQQSEQDRRSLQQAQAATKAADERLKAGAAAVQRLRDQRLHEVGQTEAAALRMASQLENSQHEVRDLQQQVSTLSSELAEAQRKVGSCIGEEKLRVELEAANVRERVAKEAALAELAVFQATAEASVQTEANNTTMITDIDVSQRSDDEVRAAAAALNAESEAELAQYKAEKDAEISKLRSELKAATTTARPVRHQRKGGGGGCCAARPA